MSIDAEVSALEFCINAESDLPDGGRLGVIHDIGGLRIDPLVLGAVLGKNERLLDTHEKPQRSHFEVLDDGSRKIVTEIDVAHFHERSVEVLQRGLVDRKL